MDRVLYFLGSAVSLATIAVLVSKKAVTLQVIENVGSYARSIFNGKTQEENLAEMEKVKSPQVELLENARLWADAAWPSLMVIVGSFGLMIAGWALSKASPQAMKISASAASALLRGVGK